MGNALDSKRLAERSRVMFDKVAALPDGDLPSTERKQLFDALQLLSNNIRFELMDMLRKAGNDPQRVESVNRVLNAIDDFQLKTKMDALIFVTECLGLAQLLPYAEMPATSRPMTISESVYGEMYDKMRIFAQAIIERSDEIITHDDLYRLLYGEGSSAGHHGKLAQLASRANKILEPYGQIMAVYGKGYMWKPKS